MKINIYFRTLKQYGLTTQAPEPEKPAGSEYCSRNRCYTPTEFALFGVGTVVMGIMVGVVGISWFKHQCLPEEYEDLREREKERERRAEMRRNKDFSVQYRDDDEGGFLDKEICKIDEPRTKLVVMRQPSETDF